MLVIGHIGLTLGAAILITRFVPGRCYARDGKLVPHFQQFANATSVSKNTGDKTSWIEHGLRYKNAGLLLVGSLLPDIIDKPVGQIFLPENFSNGRIFRHTLLFLLLISIIGFYLYRHRRRTWLLILSFGIFTHLIFDQMWWGSSQHTLLWPFYGVAFEREDITNWIPNMLYALLKNPEVYVPELAGMAILVWLIQAPVRMRTKRAMVKHVRV